MTEAAYGFREETTGEVCPACGEAKRVRYVPWFSPWSANAEEARPLPCACGRRKAVEDTERGYRLIRAEARRIARIPGAFCGVSLSSGLPIEGQTAAAALLADFAAGFREDRHTPGVMLLGGTGRGKSRFASAAANTVIDEYPISEADALDCGKKGIVCDQHRISPVRFASFTETVSTMRAEISAGGAAYRVEERLKRARLLVLDDLGTERLSEYAAEVLFRIVDHREKEGLPMIITSNMTTPERMRGHLGERIFSRLNGMCRPVVFECDDLRGNALRPACRE
jgi:DNA replication protein DnaC